MKTRLTIVTVFLVLLFVALTFGQVLLLRFLIFAALVLAAGYLWAGYSSRRISLKVGGLPETCRVGESFEVTLAVASRGRLPTSSLLTYPDNGLSSEYPTLLADLPPRGHASWRHRVHCRQRGYHQAGLFAAASSDPIGLFTRRRLIGEAHRVLVYPKTVPLPFFEYTAASLPGYGFGNRFNSQVGTDAGGVRAYAPGDSLSHIHWRSTARTGNIMVKVFDDARATRDFEKVWLILDLPPASGGGTEDMEECAVTIAASLLEKYAEGGLPVGLAVSGDRQHFLPPEWGEGHSHQVMAALAVTAAGDDTPADQLVVQHEEHFRGNGMAVVIAPSDGEAVPAATRRLVSLGNLVVAILLDAPSSGGNASVPSLAPVLAARGIATYVVRKGADLARALDSRNMAAPGGRS